MILYPRLERSEELKKRAAKLGSMTVAQCRDHRQTADPEAFYTATGGDRASPTQLEKIAGALTDIAAEHGYPDGRARNTAADAKWGEWLHRNLDTSAHEASLDSMWHFFTVVVGPDLVRWRWGATKDEATSDRWVTVKHRGRNAFGRLWWRCEILKDVTSESPYHLVHALGEDELVQIMERPSFAGNRTLSRISAATLLQVAKKQEQSNRAQILREYQKRMLRLGAFTDFQALDADATGRLTMEVFDRTLSAMKVAQ